MRILVFGHNGYVGGIFTRLARSQGHSVVTVSSASTDADYVVDMTIEEDVVRFNPDGQFDGVFFCQGLNPSVGLDDANFKHFVRMYQVNIAAPALLIRKLLPKLSVRGSVLFLGSSAVRRGSYDPAYGSCKAALTGMINSLARYHPQHRFNLISLALVQGSPVSQGMPEERRAQHASAMFGTNLVDPEGVARLALEILVNPNINRAEYPLDGGMAT